MWFYTVWYDFFFWFSYDSYYYDHYHYFLFTCIFNYVTLLIFEVCSIILCGLICFLGGNGFSIPPQPSTSARRLWPGCAYNAPWTTTAGPNPRAPHVTGRAQGRSEPMAVHHRGMAPLFRDCGCTVTFATPHWAYELSAPTPGWFHHIGWIVLGRACAQLT